MDIKIEQLTTDNKYALKIKNEPFQLTGSLAVFRLQDKWSYNITFYPSSQTKSQVFPDENYNFSEIEEDGIAIGAFDHTKAIGLGIFKNQPFKYLYLDDLKISSAYRRQGIGKKILEQACQIAKENNYAGIFTIGQDNNLDACLFYLSFGFTIGSLNTKVYDYTPQTGKADIYFYYDF